MVGILIATHCSLADSLLETARTILGEAPGMHAICISHQTDREHAWNAMLGGLDTADDGDGVLVLVDMFGGTPSNLAMAMLAHREVAVLTGVNLPMVLRSANRRETMSLHDLAEDVLAYGRRNVSASAEWLRPTPSQSGIADREEEAGT